ncbi:Protein of unknown function DUF1847 [Methanohalobium evestigatum Z-7303]|uniref:Metal-binding protein n=1 Tax=Methanohalobium evestigatum (strain ATCC BAA-1072 / DSM 3721 / NBRC 107634 / OCM 161 / Z-7303) TaxID=644295 RepID=D7EBT0_METEZ|nr:DUF1847 domain-containing protein [Methanohalobium evestigatum]ADI74922.1 Protein of unknown function DUF1847 [Methanohalobium evestigatum Z-7303]
MRCALCIDKQCTQGRDCTNIADNITYKGKDYKSMKISSQIESRYYMEKTRIEEVVLYAKKMNYKKLGIAFCIGLENEANIVHNILSKEFDVYSVCCKVCGTSKDEYDLDKFHDKGFEVTCNPKAQAMVLNNNKTDLNIQLGLCIGHDILFNNNSNAPVTVLVVKDRMLAHNPLGAIYSGYYLKNRFNL